MEPRQTTSRRPAAIVRASAAALAASLLLGCAGGGADVATPEASVSADRPIAPVVRGAEAGLESRLWVVENRPGVLAGALGAYRSPASAGATSEAWEANGLRVFEIPLDELDHALSSLPTVGPRHRQWMGLLPEWVEVVKGATLASERVVDLDNGPVHIGPGRFRLAARCWVSPAVGAGPEGPGARMTLEIVPQILMTDPRAPSTLERLIDGERDAPGSRRDVLAFDRLRLRVDASGDSAIVIVAERPGADWSAAASSRPETEAEGIPSDYGPRFPAPPSLGELMLTNRALPDSMGDARIIVILVPRVPERFELLPR